MANWHQNVFTIPISYSTTDLDVRESPDGTLIIVSLLGKEDNHVSFPKENLKKYPDEFTIAKSFLVMREQEKNGTSLLQRASRGEFDEK